MKFIQVTILNINKREDLGQVSLRSDTLLTQIKHMLDNMTNIKLMGLEDSYADKIKALKTSEMDAWIDIRQSQSEASVQSMPCSPIPVTDNEEANTKLQP